MPNHSTLVESIINELTNEDTSLTFPLLKTKVLAFRLENKELLDWVDAELNGYLEEEGIPDYRKCPAMIFGDGVSSTAKFTQHQLPTMNIEADWRKRILRGDLENGVATLESYIEDDKVGVLEVILPPEVTEYIASTMRQDDPSVNLFRSKKLVAKSFVTEALSAIRSRLLNLMLEIEKDLGHMSKIDSNNKAVNQKITKIVNKTIIKANGDGNVINTGDNVNATVSVSISKGSQEDLKAALESIGIDSDDISKLLRIVDDESPDARNTNFGVRVNSWIKGMLDKSLDGSWQIGIGAAGNMLAEILGKYYGG